MTAEIRPPADSNTLTARVFAIDGVTDIYAPSAVITQVPHLLSALVTGQAERVNRVEITTSRDGRTTVSVRIGTDTHTSTADTARRVADTLLEEVTDLPEARVTVQVARIA